MVKEISNNRRIAKNTIMLYIRMLLTMIVGLYTSRVVLQVLGISDYGLYNVVGGIVSLFLFLNSTLRNGTQRFLSFVIGKNDENLLKKVFANALILHIIIAVIILILAETIGLWFVCNKLVVEPNRYEAALWCYQFSIIASIVAILQVPYLSVLISHEKMNIYAYMSIFDVIMKLSVVFIIMYIDFDKLILYACSILVVHSLSSAIYIIYCKSQYNECTANLIIDKKILKEMASFSGWVVIGMCAATSQGQGLNMLLNMFFGTVVNAARGIAFQVNNIIMQFVNNFQVAVNPQIVKLYAASKYQELYTLVIGNSKYAAYLFLFIMIPVFINIEYVLSIWLGEYPKYSAIFLRLVLIQSLFQTISRPIIYVTHAVGLMKMPNVVAGSFILFFIPLSYFLLKHGWDPISIVAINIIPWIVESIVDLYYSNKYCGFPILRFLKEVYGRIMFVGIIMFAVPTTVFFLTSTEDWRRFLLVNTTSVCTSLLSVYYLGIDKTTRTKVNNLVYQEFLRITNL